MSGYRPATSTVRAMADVSISGNVIPIVWYQRLRFKPDAAERKAGRPGKPHSVAVAVLGDLVYWYRPAEIRDERTGEVIGLARKFAGKALQRSYGYYEDLFGYSYDQVRTAVDFLVERGLVSREVTRHVELPTGAKLGNVMFLEVVPDAIRKLSEPVLPPSGMGPDGDGEPRPLWDTAQRGLGYSPEGSGIQPIHTETSYTEISYTENSRSSPRSDCNSAHARPRETASERASDESSDDLKTRSSDRILERFEALTGTRPTAKDRQEAAKLAEAGTPIAAVERGVLAAIDRAKPDRPGSLRYCLRHIAEAARGAAQSAVGAPRESRTPVEAPEVAPAPKIATGGQRTQAATPATTGANALALDAPPLCEVRIDQAYLLREREATRAISSPPPKGEAEYVDRPEYRLAEIAFCARTSFLAAFDRQPNRHELADHVWPLAVEAGIDPGVIERWYPLRPETTYQQHEVAPGRVPANERHGGSVRDASGRRPDGACVESVSTVKGDARDGAPARRIDGGLDETHGSTGQGGFPALALSQPGEGTSTEVLSQAGRIFEFPSPAHAASATVEAGDMAAGLDALAADPFEARRALLQEQCAQLLRRESRQEEVGQ